MRKIVINKCFGGFGLSDAAIRRYLELKGIQYGTQASRWTWRETSEDFYHAEHVGDDDYYISDRDFPRDDQALIQVVEEMGEAASNELSALATVEIPDDVEWQISEYDGNEWVAEKHRTWS